MSLGDVEPVDGDSILTTATNATNATNTTVTSMKGEGRKGRPKGKTGSKGKRQPRGKATAKATEDMPEEVPGSSLMEVDDEPASRKPAKRTRKKGNEPIDDSQAEIFAISKPPPARRAGRKKKAEEPALPDVEDEQEHRLSEDASQLISELMEATEPPGAPQTNTKRGTKRTSDGLPKADSSQGLLDEASSPVGSHQKQPKRGKKGNKQAAASSQVAAPAEPSSIIDQSIISQSTNASKPKRGGKPKQSKPQEKSQKVKTNTSSAVSSDPPKPKSPSPPNHQVTEEKAPATSAAAGQELEQDLKTSTPIRLSHNGPTKAMTPSPSPQSSDAENKPPSSRPSIPLSQQRPTSSRAPLAPATPIRSPSKRNNNNNVIKGGLATTHPWRTIDLETVFLPSPNSKAVAAAAMAANRRCSDENKENLCLASIDVQKPLEQVVKEVKALLTSPEKHMSVEEWICFNARQGEGKMRDECERLVSIFETEGGKAMRALEGIECLQ